jgi:hypothetical protein
MRRFVCAEADAGSRRRRETTSVEITYKNVFMGASSSV